MCKDCDANLQSLPCSDTRASGTIMAEEAVDGGLVYQMYTCLRGHDSLY